MSAYKGKDGRWRYRFSFKGRRYSGSAPKGDNTKRAAELLERKHLEKLERGVFTGAMPKFREFMRRYLEHQQARVKASTYELQESHLRVHVEPVLGDVPLDEVDQLRLDQLVTGWSRASKTHAPAKPRTINSRLISLGRLLSLAVEWKILPAVPKMPRVKVPEDTPRFLDHAEASAVLAAADGRWRSMILVGLRTGLRIGELRGLQWIDVDLVRAQLYVRRSDPGVAGREASTPKSGKGRTLPLSPDAVEALRVELDISQRRHGDQWTADLPVWEGAPNWKDQRDRRRTRSEHGCKSGIGRALARAGIQNIQRDRLGWHTLRHTFASWLVIRGVPLRVVQELLGHASIRMTERYAHLAPNATHHGAVASLDYAIAPPTEQPSLPPGA